MADDTESSEDKRRDDLPTATAVPRKADDRRRGVLVDPNVLLAGLAVALLGIGVVAAFLWMVPTAAAREADAACRGLGGYNPPHEQMCPDGKPCRFPFPAPDFTALDHQNRPVKLSELRGKAVMLNFTASWCGVCKTEKPGMADMLGDLGSDDFVVVTLSSDRSWANVLVGFIQSLAPEAALPKPNPEGVIAWQDALAAYNRALPDGIPFKVWLDPPAGDDTIGKITKSWGVTAVPETALIDKNGNVRAFFVNKRDWSSSVAQTCLRSIIDE